MSYKFSNTNTLCNTLNYLDGILLNNYGSKVKEFACIFSTKLIQWRDKIIYELTPESFDELIGSYMEQMAALVSEDLLSKTSNGADEEYRTPLGVPSRPAATSQLTPYNDQPVTSPNRYFTPLDNLQPSTQAQQRNQYNDQHITTPNRYFTPLENVQPRPPASQAQGTTPYFSNPLTVAASNLALSTQRTPTPLVPKKLDFLSNSGQSEDQPAEANYRLISNAELRRRMGVLDDTVTELKSKDMHSHSLLEALRNDLIVYRDRVRYLEMRHGKICNETIGLKNIVSMLDSDLKRNQETIKSFIDETVTRENGVSHQELISRLRVLCSLRPALSTENLQKISNDLDNALHAIGRFVKN